LLLGDGAWGELDEGPFAALSQSELSGADSETAHAAVEAAASAIARAEIALRAGEKKQHSVQGDKARFESQIAAANERLGQVHDRLISSVSSRYCISMMCMHINYFRI